jgi:membrane fusion protein (multidrug efflux system)
LFHRYEISIVILLQNVSYLGAARALHLTDKARPLLDQLQNMSARTRAEALADLSADGEIDRRMAPRASKANRARRNWQQRVRLPLIIVVPAVAALIGGYLYVIGGRYVSTDDAYVQSARVSISSDVLGRVVAVEVHDNQRVKAGQILFRLDDRPYRIAVEDAEAQLASAHHAKLGKNPGRAALSPCGP